MYARVCVCMCVCVCVCVCVCERVSVGVHTMFVHMCTTVEKEGFTRRRIIDTELHVDLHVYAC